MDHTGRRRVLVIAYDCDRAAAWADALSPDNDTAVAATVRNAIKLLDESVDVLLIAETVPESSTIIDTARDRGLDVRVGLVTAHEPTVDPAKFGFDDVLVEPFDRGELRKAVHRLRRLARYDAAMRECYSLTVEKARLDAQADTVEPPDDEYDALAARLEEVRDRLEQLVGSFDDEELDAIYRNLTPECGAE